MSNDENEQKPKKYQRPRQSSLSPAAQVLQTLLQNGKSPIAEQFIRWKLWNSWEEVVGAEIAQHTLPVGYLDGTLYVWVDSGPRLQELTFLIRPFREKINNFAGKHWANSIRFTLDRKSVPKPAETAEDLREYLSTSPPNEGEEPPPGR